MYAYYFCSQHYVINLLFNTVFVCCSSGAPQFTSLNTTSTSYSLILCIL